MQWGDRRAVKEARSRRSRVLLPGGLMTNVPRAIKRAELTSAVGAGVLGAGLALLMPLTVARYAAPILALGLFMHAWGMFEKHRLERASTVPTTWWAELLYWVCWVALGVLALYMILR